MKKIVCIIGLAGVAFLAGCTAKNVQDAGVGMQIGSAAGGALSGYVAGVGIVADIAGDLMGVDRSPKPGTPEFEKMKDSFRLIVAKGKIVDNFKDQAQITAETNSGQINAAAQKACSDYDKLFESKGFAKVRIRQPSPVMRSLADGEEGDFYLFRAVSNPYREKCVKDMIVVGNRFVKKAKNEGKN